MRLIKAKPSDFDSVYPVIMNSLENLSDNLPNSIDNSMYMMSDMIDHYYYEFFIIDENGFQGYVYAYRYRPDDKNIVIYSFSKNKEIRKMSLLEMKRILFDNVPLHKIFVYVLEDDKSLIEICNSLMELEGRFIEYVYHDGCYKDVLLYGWKV